MASQDLMNNGHHGHSANGGPRDITVLVTGFGPFQERYPVNPSYEITRRLPEALPQPTPGGHKVRIIRYEQPIRVAYEDVQRLVPDMHATFRGTVDLVLHIGMASGRRFYALERYAHRDGYGKNKDLDGNVLSHEDGSLRFPDCPAVMTTSLNCNAVLKRWQANVCGMPEDAAGFAADCRESTDAGRYLCDYIYFNSLAWFGRDSKHPEEGKVTDRPVLFLHVPPESDAEMLEQGLNVTVALIEAMVDTWSTSLEHQTV